MPWPARVDIDLRHRAARHGPGRPAGLPARTSGRRSRKSTKPSPAAIGPEMFRAPVRQRLRRQPDVERDRRQRGRAVRTGTTAARTSRSRRSWSSLRPTPDADPADLAAPACWRCWAIRSRPTTSRRPARSPRTARPASTCMEHGVAPRRLQQLRLAARQRPRDDPRHVRQHPHAQPARPRHRRRRHAAPARRASR